VTDGTNRFTDANTTNVKQPCSDSIKLAIDRNAIVPPIIRAPCFSRFVDAQVPNLMMLPSTITEGIAQNITVTIHSVQTPMMLDTGAELSVIPPAMMANFDPLFRLPLLSRKSGPLVITKLLYEAHCLLIFSCV